MDESGRDNESVLSGNIPADRSNFVNSSSESNFEKDAERPDASLVNDNNEENKSVPYLRRGSRGKQLPTYLKDFFVNDDFEITEDFEK